MKISRCSSCRSTFDTAEERHSHMETAHSAECPICKKVYTSSYLKEHMTFHNESSRVTCNICSKVFSSISNLRKHQKKHEKNGYPPIEKKRLYKCSECIETFLNEKDLEVSLNFFVKQIKHLHFFTVFTRGARVKVSA